MGFIKLSDGVIIHASQLPVLNGKLKIVPVKVKKK